MPVIKPALARLDRDGLCEGTTRLVALAGDGVDGVTSAVVTVRGGVVRAFLNRCPHARWPLETFDGRLLQTGDGALLCAAHGALFDPASGACLGGPGRGAPLLALVVESQAADGGGLVLRAP